MAESETMSIENTALYPGDYIQTRCMMHQWHTIVNENARCMEILSCARKSFYRCKQLRVFQPLLLFLMLRKICFALFSNYNKCNNSSTTETTTRQQKKHCWNSTISKLFATTSWTALSGDWWSFYKSTTSLSPRDSSACLSSFWHQRMFFFWCCIFCWMLYILLLLIAHVSSLFRCN